MYVYWKGEGKSTLSLQLCALGKQWTYQNNPTDIQSSWLKIDYSAHGYLCKYGIDDPIANADCCCLEHDVMKKKKTMI